MNEGVFKPDEVVLEGKEISMAYRIARQSVPVLSNVSVSVQRGETVCIRGASGAGKSTLLHILGGLERPTSGSVLCRNEMIYTLSEKRRASFRAREVGFVFQSYHLLPELDVLENALLPAMSQGGYMRRKRELEKVARSLLIRVGLEHRLHHRPMELSGGEQQRAALARALMNQPEIVLADEPTGNLDSHTGEQVLEYLFELVREHRHTLVMVTHNDDVASRCDRILLLEDGCLTAA